MLQLVRAALAAGLMISAGSAFSAERIATFHVDDVSCATCAPIVKGAIGRMQGVSSVTLAPQADGSALVTVRYDDAKVVPDALARASTEAGYPARLRTD